MSLIINGSYAKDESENILDSKNVFSSSSSISYIHRLSLAVKYLNSMVTETNTAKVLDIGCSNGAFLRMQQSLARDFNTKSLYYVGVDIREKVLLRLSEEAKLFMSEKQYVNVFTELGDISDASFAKSLYKVHNQFDCIIAMEIIEHLPKERLGAFLKHTNKLLRANGRMVVTTPIHFKEEPMHYPEDHAYEYTLEECRELLGKHYVIREEIGLFPVVKELRSLMREDNPEFYKLYKELISRTKSGATINNLFGTLYSESCRCMMFICDKRGE